MFDRKILYYPISLSIFSLALFFFHPENISLNAQPIDAPYGCHHIHNNHFTWQAFTHRSEDALKVKRRSDTLNLYHYEIHLDVTAFSQRTIRARTIVYLESLMDSVSTVTLDLEGLQVDSVKLNNEMVNYSYDDRYLRVFPDEHLLTGDSIFVEVQYHGTPITCPSGFGGFYFEDGYAYNLGIGLAADPHNFGRSWYPCFDNFVQRSTFEYHVKSSGGRKAYCVGRFLGEEELGGDTIIRSYLMEQPIPTYLSSVAISNYRTMNWTHDGAYGPVDIELVARSGDLDNFRTSVQDMEAAIDALQYWYGPYPFERIGYVLTSRGAMEHPTNTAYPASSVAGGQSSTRLMAHELCHHWWGNITTLSTANNMWIKEGPAEYGAHLTFEWLGGPEGLREAVRNNHRTTIETAHIVDGDYFALSPMPAFNTYGRHTYFRGASMIHNLRGYLGDSLFRSGMQDVLNANFFSAIDAYEFRDQLTYFTGIDLECFFDDWIFSPGYSDFSVDSFRLIREENEKYLYEVHFKQGMYKNDHFHCNVPQQLTFGKGRQLQSVRLMASGEISKDSIWLDFEPEWVTHNNEHLLNLAGFTSFFDITGESNINDLATQSRIVTNSVDDSLYLFIEHHYTGPDPGSNEDPDFRISRNHYFVIGGDIREDWDATIILRYDARGNLQLDEDLTSVSEDSLILVYRPDRSAEWMEYPYYVKNMLIPTNGRGFINIQKVLPGEYAFANSFFRDPVSAPEISYADYQIEIFPNPITDNFLNIKPGLLEGEFRISVFDSSGKEYNLGKTSFQSESTETIQVPVLPSGQYFLQLRGEGSGNKNIIATEAFIIQ